MTREAKLKAIINDQMKGGYDNWKESIELLNNGIHGDFGLIDTLYRGNTTILLILLDSDGAKAAYPHDPDGSIEDYWAWATDEILEAWHSSKGNNWKAAIDTAYDLLPKS